MFWRKRLSRPAPILALLVLSALLAACTSAAHEPTAETTQAEQGSGSQEGGSSSPVTLTIAGAVEAEQSWSEDQVLGMDTIDTQAANSQGEQDTYTGVLLADLLSRAQPQAGATTVVFSDGEEASAEFALDQILSCGDCILSFRSRGGFSLVIPGNNPDLPVRGVVLIEVQ